MSIEAALAVEPQPDFPLRDLTESNAVLLSLILSNEAELMLNHGIAEQVSRVFRVGHPAIQNALLHTTLDFDVQDAVNHGVIAYEAITTLVQHVPIASGEDATITAYNAVALEHLADADEVVDYLSAARTKFEDKMPVAAGVIYEASQRFWGPMAGYALHGAAIGRQFDYNAVA